MGHSLGAALMGRGSPSAQVVPPHSSPQQRGSWGSTGAASPGLCAAGHTRLLSMGVGTEPEPSHSTAMGAQEELPRHLKGPFHSWAGNGAEKLHKALMLLLKSLVIHECKTVLSPA